MNHEFFWKSLVTTEKEECVELDSDSDLGKEIDKAFGSFEAFKSNFLYMTTYI